MLIGIIYRESVSENGNKIYVIYQDMVNSIIKSGGIPIGIDNKNIRIYLDLCDGFILQGGDEVDFKNFLVIEEIRKRGKPLLGICLGMQEIAMYFNGLMCDILGHKMKSSHDVLINENSLLYKIIGKDKIKVNSRHNSAIMHTDLQVGGIANDGIIEEIESSQDNFLVGIQWHPENIYDSSIESRELFDYFIHECARLKKR